MQISRKPLEHNRRHQKKKTTGKCSIQQAQIYTRRHEDYSLNQDQNTICVCRKHISIQHSEPWAVTQDLEDQIDVLQINFTQNNTRYQVAREDQQHSAIHEDTGSQMESSQPEMKTEMV